jgi:dihydrofolate reductase
VHNKVSELVSFDGKWIKFFLKSLADIKKLKYSKGSDIQVWGSGELIQLLLRNDLVDELWLKIHPLTLGKGKKL